MALTSLGSRLRDIFNKVTRAPVMSENLREDSLKELQKALITADVEVKLVLDFTNKIRDKLRKEKLPTGLSQKEFFVKTVYDDLVGLMGKEHAPAIKPQRVFLVGTYGHGKTSTTAKLAKFFSKRGLKTAMICTDTWRPAAYEQLSQLGKKVGVKVFGKPKEKDPVKILGEGLKEHGKADVVIVDSAGRDSLNEELINEIKTLAAKLKADETYLVIGADMGQTASKQAKEFNKAGSLTGVIVTRMDSSAKGGGALSACAKAGVPITFLGTGEKMDDLDIYDPKRYVARLLGFGDLKSLMEKAREVVEEEELSPEELVKGEFTLKKFYKQLEASKKMGPFQKVLDQMGLGSQLSPEMVEQSEEKMKAFKHIMDSMTPEELEKAELIDKSRVRRIAKGSGQSEKEVRALLKQFKQTKKMLSKLKGGKRLPRKLSRMLGKFGMPGAA